MSSLYSIGAMNQLGNALEAAGFTSDDITKLKQFRNLKGVKDVVSGCAEIVPIANIVDCDAMPEILSDWQREEHQKGGSVKLEHHEGKLYANDQEVIRFLSEKQKDGKVVGGHELRKELKDRPVLNACMLDYLLKHPELIPEEWKNGVTYFWGTIFRYSGGNLYVACLRWNGGRWGWGYYWLDCDWGVDQPAACLASS